MNPQRSPSPPPRAPLSSAALALTALSAALYTCSFPPLSWVPLSWLALVPLFAALRNRGPLAAAVLGGSWGFLATIGVLAWIVPTLHGHFERSLVASLAFLAGIALVAACPFNAACFALTAGKWHRAAAPPRVLLLAAAFVAAEYLRTQLGLRSPWALLGDAHHGSERLRQVADLAGVYGVSGVVALANAALAELLVWMWERARGLREAAALDRIGVAAAPLVLVSVLAYGEWRIAHPPRSAATLDIALVQGNLPAELRWRRSSASRVLRRYGGMTRDLLVAREGEPRPDLVLWPENAIQTAIDHPRYGPPLRGLARRGVPLLLGAPHSERAGGERRHFNSAFLLLPDGGVARYDKRRLLPFGETPAIGTTLGLGARGDLDSGYYSAGSTPGVLAVGGRLIGVLICMEALYPDLAREAVAEGAAILVNLSNDGWLLGHGASLQHFGQIVYRAIETRRPLIRATSTGITAVISATGEVEARLPEGGSGVLRARVALPAGPPPLYARLGDVFALGCLLACLAVPVSRLAQRARERGYLACALRAPGSQRQST